MWWAELSGEAGFRPVAIVSRSDMIAKRRNVTVAEVTTRVRGSPSEVPLSQADGMPRNCVINADNLHTIPKERLRVRIMALTDAAQFALAGSLRYSLELDW